MKTTRKAVAAPKRAMPSSVRIIGGQWKRTPLPVASQEGLRPTPGRVRETVFNWLGQTMTGQVCVDAFAGTGALGFEAASRGAQRVVLFEQDAALVRKLDALKAKLQADMVEIRKGDALWHLGQLASGSVDGVFLDPPFGVFTTAAYEAALKQAARITTEHGWIYLEANQDWGPEALAPLGLAVVRQGCAGVVHFHLLQKQPSV